MIRITIDKSAASPEELAALDAMPEVLGVINTIAAVGRGYGIALTVLEPVGAEAYRMARTMYPADQITPEIIRLFSPTHHATS